MTNGDAIISLYPNQYTYRRAGRVHVWFEICEEYDRQDISFDEEWWDAPYDLAELHFPSKASRGKDI